MRPPAMNGVALAQRSFVAALGLLDAMVAVTGRPELFALKWPNDVLLGGRQGRGDPARDRRAGGAAAGARHRDRGQPRRRRRSRGSWRRGRWRRRACAGATGIAIGPEDFLDLLAPAVDAWEERLADEGFAPLRAAWLARATPDRRGDHRAAARPGARPGGSRPSTPRARWCSRPTRAGWCCRRRRSISRRRAMLLAIDVGNTNMVFALHDGQPGGRRVALPHRAAADGGRVFRLARAADGPRRDRGGDRARW